MKVLVSAGVWLILGSVLHGGGLHGESLPPREAADKVGREVTVEFEVRSTGFNAEGFHELYSEKSWQNPDAFFVRIPVRLWDRLRKLGIHLPDRHFEGKVIRATGVVKTVKFGNVPGHWPVIYLDDLDRLEVLPPRYMAEKIEGFTVHLAPALAADARARGMALEELRAQLKEVVRVLPEKPLEALRHVALRLEFNEKEHAAYYSWGKVQPEKNPLLAQGLVVLANARLFVEWSRKGQPSMVLHELAHAYHHRILGGDHPGVSAAYRQAMERKLYESVPYVHGGKKKAYATTNDREYFAELTEAYFGKNDFFPFTRGDLEKHDPLGYRLMRSTWESGRKERK